MPDMEAVVSETLTDLPGKLNLWNVITILLVILCAVVVSRVILALVSRALKRSKMDPALVKIIRTAVKFVVGIVCVLLICDTLGIEITSLIALFSVVGLALSLAVQGVLANLAGGMVILWAKPFHTGDFVEVDGVVGKVKETSLFYTKLNTTDNKLVSIPNKLVSEAKVLNFTAESTRRVETVISVSYNSPIDEVKQALLAALEAEPLVLADPAPVVGVSAFGSSAIEYTIWAWCKNEEYWPAFYRIHETVKKALDENGLEMTYDHLNVHMVSQAPVKKEV